MMMALTCQELNEVENLSTDPCHAAVREALGVVKTMLREQGVADPELTLNALALAIKIAAYEVLDLGGDEERTLNSLNQALIGMGVGIGGAVAAMVSDQCGLGQALYRLNKTAQTVAETEFEMHQRRKSPVTAAH